MARTRVMLGILLSNAHLWVVRFCPPRVQRPPLQVLAMQAQSLAAQQKWFQAEDLNRLHVRTQLAVATKRLSLRLLSPLARAARDEQRPMAHLHFQLHLEERLARRCLRERSCGVRVISFMRGTAHWEVRE